MVQNPDKDHRMRCVGPKNCEMSVARREKRARNVLELDTKLEIIRIIDEENLTYENVAKKFCIGRSTVGDIYKSKEKYIAAKEKHYNPRAKIIVTENEFGSLIDSRVYQWFCGARARNLPVSGDLLKQKARLVADSINSEKPFLASNGWLCRFQKRYQITGRILSGESRSMDQDVVDDWVQQLPEKIVGYEPEDIYNCDESGLYFRGLPNRSLCSVHDDGKNVKVLKDRLTILFTVSWTGEKLIPFIIGKSKMPRCFQKKLPVGIIWKHNKSAWMTTNLFVDYLNYLNNVMVQRNKKIILLLDNCTVHSSIELTNVKLLFLPKNTTAGTQPLDAGIIKNFKHFYRKHMLNYLFETIFPAGQTKMA